MARIFISHSSANNAEALALRDWLVARGWDDLFLDIDPHRGLVSGQRWLDRLQESAQRCKAVLFVLSRAWLASRYCTAEFWEARKQERPLFAVVIDDTAVTEVPAEMRGVWQLAFLTRGSRFETFSVQPPPDYVSTPVRFSYEGLESLRLGLAQAGLTSFDTESFPWPAPGFEHEADGTTPRRPYRGLKPVDIPDAGVFFGRDADLVRVRYHLANLHEGGGRRLVVLLGASGSGKSSFLRAGLWPRLERDDRRFLPLPVLRPRGAAMWGDEGLLAALEAAHRKAELAFTRADLRKDLEAGGAAFLRRLADLRSAAARGLPEDAKPPTLVLPIDQAEELFTTVRDDRPAEAGLFLARLAEILRHGPEALALVTIRSDAYEPLQTAEALAGVPQIPVNLPTLTAADYRSVIEGPADRATGAGRSLILEPELVKALLADAQGADALPLLGFTLERLYVEHGGDGDLTVADYDALGGVQGSIEAAVDEAFSDPDAVPRIPADAAEREKLLKRAFVPHLMGVNEANGEPVRRTARLVDLPAETRGLVDRLIERRLLVVDRRAEETVIEVAHEALLRRWPTLRRWLDEERAALQAQQEVARAASAWSQNGCKANSDWLTHRGSRLAEAEAVARREDFDKVFEGVPRAYLEACRQAEDAARDAEVQRLARQRTMQRRVGILLTIVGVVTLVGGWLVVAGQRDLARQTSGLIVSSAQKVFEEGQYDRAMRLALTSLQSSWFVPPSEEAKILLGRAAHFSLLEAQLAGHARGVGSASFSPDGAHIITKSAGGTAWVWSLHDDGIWQRAALKNHHGPVTYASFSPDGTRIIAASPDKTVRVWSQDGSGVWHSSVLKGFRGPVGLASFSPDGTRIITTAFENVTRVWSSDKEGAWHSVVLQGHQSPVVEASFSPNSKSIVTTATRDNTARVWSSDEEGAWHSVVLKGHQKDVFSASFSPDSTRIVTTSLDNTVRVWSLGKDGAWQSIVLKQGSATSASFSPDNTHIVTAGGLDNAAQVWSLDKDGTWHSVVLEGHQGSVFSASFSSDGMCIVTASGDKTARVWSQNKEGIWTSVVLKGHQGAVTSAFFSPDGARIITTSEDKTARVWGRGDGGVWASIVLKGHQEAITSTSFSSDGLRIVTASEDKTVRVWNRSENGPWQSTVLKGHQEAVTSASFSSDGARIITASRDKTAQVWSRDEDGIWNSFTLLVRGPRGSVTSASFSPDGGRILTTSVDIGARIWSKREDGTWASVALDSDSSLITASFSSDGTRIVTGSLFGSVRVWNQGEGGLWTNAELEGHQQAVASASFSPDGLRIVTGSFDRTARVWSQGENGAWHSIVLEIHSAPVTSVSFSPDGDRIVSTSNDGTVRVWSQGENGIWTSITLEGHPGSVTSASFSPDGTHIVTASEDGTARVWNVRWLMGPGDWAKAEPLSLPETVCREKLRGSWVTVKDPKTGRSVERIAERLLTVDDIQVAPILAGREGEDVCAPFLEPQPWWSRLAFWR